MSINSLYPFCNILAIVDMVNLRKSFTSTHKTFENAMAKLDMLFNIVVLLFVIVAFLIAYDVGVQQYAVGVSSVSVAKKKYGGKTLMFSPLTNAI